MEQKHISIATLIAVLLVGLVAAYGAFRPGPTISGFAPQGVSNMNSLHLAVETAQATGTPGLYIDNDSVARSIEVVEPAGTAVFSVDSDGTVTGYLLQYGSSGYKIICNTTEITGTGALAHGLATPVAVFGSLAEDVTGDHAHLSFTNASATVTAKLWDTALTPAASQAGANVDWCVVGVP